MRRARPIRAADKALVDRLLTGDEEAYDELFAVHVPRLYRIALSRLGQQPEVAEDLVQAALIKAMAKLSTYRGEAALLTWLSTFCLREISAYYKKCQRVPSHVALEDDVPEVAAALEILENWGSGPEEEALRTEVGRLVQATLDRLPPRYASLLEWKYLEGLSVKEIAGRLETGPIAVQSLLSRAREAFRAGFASVGACAGLNAVTGVRPDPRNEAAP